MLKSLQIYNFKSIESMILECGNINLLVGVNSSGKSTVMQALLMCAQSLNGLSGSAGLNGDLVELGSFEENYCRYNGEKEIRIRIEETQGHRVDMQLRLLENNDLELHVKTPDGEKIEEAAMYRRLNYKTRQLQYLSCHRVGPERVYFKNMSLYEMIGKNGEYAISYLAKNGGKPLEYGLCKNKEDFTLLGQVNHWLKYITGANISTEEISGANLIKASYSMDELQNINPCNIGSGISYIISVLIMCLSAPVEGILVIENPEIHLHPAAQAKVCEFLYFMAQQGRQLFIESHSDHVFNGFRAGIATNTMDADMINIQFLSLDEENKTHHMKVEIGRYGNVVNSCEKLFDQFDIDLNRMLGL